WVLLDRGDAAIVPSPSYPIHIYGPLFAGADLRQVPMRGLSDPRARDDPTGACVDLEFMQRVVDFCREREMIAVHDFAYADVGFDGYRPPSILQADGA